MQWMMIVGVKKMQLWNKKKIMMKKKKKKWKEKMNSINMPIIKCLRIINFGKLDKFYFDF